MCKNFFPLLTLKFPNNERIYWKKQRPKNAFKKTKDFCAILFYCTNLIEFFVSFVSTCSRCIVKHFLIPVISVFQKSLITQLRLMQRNCSKFSQAREFCDITNDGVYGQHVGNK